ncbi:DUF2267 domain-containing protein [Larkinella soli]|uniref:DUF2267 domain-containing protein n=1 Tax=Larkinella soli TaxID=1770527 RepID=UPI000FFC1222|nr:DUF2267 domain-containing protein [Larkinella soli]
MHYNEFIHAAKDQLGLDTAEDVVRVSRAVLHTLVDHMAGNSADNLAAQLPAELGHIIREVSPEDRDQGRRFSLKEFYERVGQRAGVEPTQGKHYTHGFMKVLVQMVTEGETVKLQKILGDSYAPLFEIAST